MPATSQPTGAFRKITIFLCHVMPVNVAGMVEYVKKSETSKNEGLHRILNRLVEGISNITDTNFEPRLMLRGFRFNQVHWSNTVIN
jgi:hypothetical protein